MSGAYYSEDEYRPSSPGLERVFVKAAPSPSPEPVATQIFNPAVSSPSSRRRRKANRRKTRPTQGDWVLIREMEPNRPDIAQQVSQHALNSDSDSAPDDEEDMEDQPADTVPATTGENNHPVRSGAQPFSFQQPVKDTSTPFAKSTATSQHRDSVVEADIRSGSIVHDGRRTEVPIVINPSNGAQCDAKDSRQMSVSSATSTNHNQRNGSIAGGLPHEESLTTGSLRQLTIPPPRGLATDTLPAFQPQSPPRDAASPNTQLPSISHMVGDLPRSASISEEGSRINGFVHRPSLSSSIGQSPTSTVRQLSISSHAHSPATPFPSLSGSSPVSASSALQRRDPFLESGGHIFGADNRRPSQVSENGRCPPTLHSGSPSEGYQSSDGPSPGTYSTPIEGRPRHMSLDGALASTSAIILPLPIGSGIQHVSSHAAGSFRCDYPGCTALPFQTQYLLNSHTNVHSQNRPHYCPVAGCPRAEGGKGFKRKNEMIRHGLVHQSPGYVCPFCPDREHKYPRPDNLQRHVRVHHEDKDKDDPELREVLAQRPEGGSRGRRRRLSMPAPYME